MQQLLFKGELRQNYKTQRAMCSLAKYMGVKKIGIMEIMEPIIRSIWSINLRDHPCIWANKLKCGMTQKGYKELTSSKHLFCPFPDTCNLFAWKQDKTATDSHTHDNDSHEICSWEHVLIRKKAQERKRKHQT